MHRHTLNLTTISLTTRGRIITTFGILLLVTLFSLVPEPAQNHVTGAYPYVKPTRPYIDTPVPDTPASTPPPAKLIVKATLGADDLNWLVPLLPEWRNQVITIDKQFARLYAGARRVDKGRIADAYLRWIITNYDNLASTIVFVPPVLGARGDGAKRRARDREVERSIADLNIEHVQQVGFAPLRCPPKAACEEVLLVRNSSDAFRTMEVGMRTAWVRLFNDTDVPEKLAGLGGSAFVVSQTQIQRRSVAEYTRYWEWIAETKMDDESAGALMERLWHVIFGRESAWCPVEEECRCEVFGRC